MKVNKRFFSPLLAVAVFATATVANAAVHRVYPDTPNAIQDAIDMASPGDTILVEPGVYYADPEERYGLRISTDNLRLIGKVKKGQGEAGKVRLVYNGDYYTNNCPEILEDDPTDEEKELCAAGQQTGVYAAPADCEFDWNEGRCEDEIGEDFEDLEGFYIRGFSVEGFPKNGIQTRWVDGFEFVRNASVDNLNNGIYPTLSANGLVRNNESYGSLDTAMWVAGSENVRVMGNELHGSVIGFEITVSNNVQVTHNEIYNNSVGVGLFHPNGAGNPPLPVMKNWVIEHNDIYNNNRENDAPSNSFQADLPPGAGVLLLGVSDHVVAKNNVEDNDYVGIAVLGWCTSLFGTERACTKRPDDPPEANNNLISQNYLSGNADGGGPIPFLTVDMAYFHLADLVPEFAFFEQPGTGNCFKKNKPKNDFEYYSSTPDGELPTDGC